MARPEPVLSNLVPSLFDLAPGGVCRAASVTVRAVRSYRTLSPFAGPKPWAVSSLWHFPWTCPKTGPPDVIRHRGFRGARTFLPRRDTPPAAIARPSGKSGY